MQPSSCIRPYQATDLAAIVHIYKLARPLEFEQETAITQFDELSPNSETLRLFELSRIFVFEADNSLKGFAGYIYDYIAWLYVHPDYQRQGVGKQLLKFMLQELDAEGRNARLSLIGSNNAAKQCYIQLGFQETEPFVFNYQAQELSGVRMLRTAQPLTAL